MKGRAWIGLFALCAASSAAYAQGYIGIGGGSAEANIRAEAEEELAEIGGDCGATIACSFDESAGGSKVFLGKRFNRYFALELSYTDFGTFSAAGSGASPSGGTVDFALTAEIWSVGLAGLALLPLGGAFDLFVKAGVAYWSADLEGTATDASFGTLSESDTSEGGNLLWGAGLQWNGRRISLRAEFERIDINDVDIDLVSGSIVLRL
ncbi:MAG TPA: outer membrane beta-barrel protein [Burkholderiales bacterium]